MSDTRRFLWRAFSRNIGLISLAEQQKLFDSRVAIAGMGGVGGIHLITHVRTGIGAFNIADFDTFEIENINRQYGAAVPTFGKSKVAVMAQAALEINPYLHIRQFPEGLTEANLDDFLKDVDVVVDGIDAFALDARRLLCKGAVARGIPFVTAGPIGHGTSLMIFTPNSVGFDEHFDFRPEMNDSERLAAFLTGFIPWKEYINYMDRRYVSLNERRGPSMDIACKLCAGFAAAESVKLILGRGKVYVAPYAMRIDPYLNYYKRKKLIFGNRHPLRKIAQKVIVRRLHKGATELRMPNSIPNAFTRPGEISEDALRFLVKAGSFAISGDNSQHWKFRWNGKELVLSGDSTRSKFFYSTNGEPIYISYGAVLENISIAASALGLKSSYDLCEPLTLDGDIARIKFEKTEADVDPLFPFMYERCCNRRNYSKLPIDEKHIKELDSEIYSFPGGGIKWFNNGPERAQFTKLLVEAEKVIWRNKHYHRDLFRWMRFNNDSRDGLTLNELGLKPHEKMLVKFFANWSLMRLINFLRLNFMMIQTQKGWIKHSGGFCLLHFKGSRPVDYLNAGRMSERFWIKAQSLGISIQPMSMALALYARQKNLNGEGLEAKDRDTAEQTVKEIDTLIPEANGSLKAMIFRVGYARPTTALSARRPVDELLTISQT